LPTKHEPREPGKAEKVTFSFKESDGHIDETKEISWYSLPKGKYFFHATEIERLPSIRSTGLVPPASHTSGRFWGNLLRKARKDRLFFFTSEEDCFFWLGFMKEYPTRPSGNLVVLRFEKSVIAGSKIFVDPLLDPEHEISLSASCKIPSRNLEVCKRANNNDYCLEWIPILT
jgi:hypothetical protein